MPCDLGGVPCDLSERGRSAMDSAAISAADIFPRRSFMSSPISMPRPPSAFVPNCSRTWFARFSSNWTPSLSDQSASVAKFRMVSFRFVRLF